MTPIKFPHQQFLESNKDIIALHPLPELLQKRILGFEELQEDLAHTTDEDHTGLLGKLEKLSYELDEDLEEYFEEFLENNDEDDSEGPISQTTGLDAKESPEYTEQKTDVLPMAENVLATEEELPLKHADEIKTVPVKAVDLSDEEILDAVVQEQMKSIHPGELFKRGFKGSLGARIILVGKFCLRRGKYETGYRITLRNEKA